MWCCERRRLLFLPALMALGACGFAPLYGEGTPAAAMNGQFSVDVIDGEPGFVLREKLTGRLGPPVDPAYRLSIDLEIEQVGVALTQQNVTTRYNVIGTAVFVVTPVGGGAPVLAEEVRAITGYSAPESSAISAFAALAAERDAGRRLAAELADRILLRLALLADDDEAQ
jgi:LPS-assembly lipoprotein